MDFVKQQTVRKWLPRKNRFLIILGTLMLLAVLSPTPSTQFVRAASWIPSTTTDGWKTYGYDNAHDNFNRGETRITSTNASQLKLKWSLSAPHGISGEVVVAQGIAYWGSWDGYLHATTVNTHTTIWSTYLGVTTDSQCNPPGVGVASTPTVTTINGRLEVLVGGGDANYYALNAITGAVLWRTSSGASPAHFVWSSPAVFANTIYIGSSSVGDCPLTQGQLFQLNATTGKVKHIFNSVPNGCTGGGIWSTPTIDEKTQRVYVTTGTPSSCTGPNVYAPSLVELKAFNITNSLYHWEVPQNQQIFDSDFGATPVLFTSSTGTPMVGAANKNGIFYAFKRDDFSNTKGPIWEKQIANPGACPQCDYGSITSNAFNGQMLYLGGGQTTIGGQSCAGSVRKVNPDDGTFIWEHCLSSGPVLGAIVVTTTGIITAGAGNTALVMRASDGNTLAQLSDGVSGSNIYGGPTIAEGQLFVGNIDGFLYDYSPQGV